MNFRNVLALLSVGIVLFSCKKYEVPNNSAKDGDLLGNVQVADDFTWVTSKSFEPTISFEGEFADQFIVVEILDKKYNRIQKYFKSSTESSIEIDKQISGLTDTAYVLCSKQNIFLPFNTNEQNLVIRAGQKAKNARVQFSENHRLAQKSNCSSCDREVNSTSGNVTVGKNETVCIKGSFTGGVTLNDRSTLKICGNVSLNYINVNGDKDVVIEVGSAGRLSASNLNINEKVSVINYGRIELASSLNLNGTAVNHGEWVCSGGLNLNNKASLENFVGATLSFGGSANVNKDLINAGSINVSGNLQLNNGSNVENYCSITVSGNVAVNDEVYNGSFIKATGTSTFNSGAKFSFADKAIWVTENLTLNGGQLNNGSAVVGVFKVAGNTTLYSGFDIKSGFLDICDQNGIETNQINSGDAPSLKYCETNVSTDDCISEGVNPVQDPGGDDDNDGVDNSDDDDPEDPNIAGSFTYPSSGYAFRSFEDLWPSRGDYDFNDMVLKYQITFLVDNKNNVRKALIDYEVKAIGAGHLNGIAIQFLEQKSKEYTRHGGSIYESVNGNAFIDPTESSVIILSSNIFETISPNTYKNDGEGPDGTPYKNIVEIVFNSGSKIKSSKIHPDLFIFRTANRGLEVHLPGVPPSEAADQALFGTKEDNSINGDWYKTTENYPWGMEVHGVEGFLHPLSRVSIINAYPEFSNWVNSGGEDNQSWYQAPDINLCY